MLKIFNELQPFFEDCYRRIHVREYAKLQRISAPTASKLLEQYRQEGLLRQERDRNYIFYSAHNTNKLFIALSWAYWTGQLRNLINYVEQHHTLPTIILFGSLAKAEVTLSSDIDLVVIAPKKEITVTSFEQKLKRPIQVMCFPSWKSIPFKLLQNIVNGHLLVGRMMP